MEHKCRFCGETKDVKDFNRKLADGPYEPWNLRRCKACAHADYQKQRSKPHVLKKRQQKSSDWKKENPERHAKTAREYRKRNPEKIRAQNRLNYAVRKGRIKRLPCEVCGETENIHAHHVSYEEKDWYNVRWLCYVCHKLTHAE